MPLPSWHPNAKRMAAAPAALDTSPDPSRATVSPIRGPSVDALEPYIRARYVLFPLNRWDFIDHKGRKRGKSPRDARWRQVDYAVEDVLAWVRKGGNPGVRLGELDVVIDVDLRNLPPGVALDQALREFERRFGVDLSWFPCVVTGSGGLHFYGRLPRAARILNDLPGLPGFEFKSLGRLVVAAGAVHPDGGQYEWEALSADLADVPEIPAALFDAIRKPEEPERAEAAPAEIPLDALEECLAQLDVLAYRSHDDWLEVMMAAHSASGGSAEGREAFVRWSVADPKYKDDAGVIRERWDSLAAGKPGGVTVGTLYHHVLDAGGTIPAPPPETDFDPIPGDPAEPYVPREIMLSGRQRDAIAADVVDAIANWNAPPRLFRRAGRVVLAHIDEKGAPALREQTSARFLDVTAQAARFYTQRATDDGWKKAHAKLPQAEAGVALERLAVGEALPPLRGVADAPVMRPDGSILDQVGYDPATGLYAAFEPLALEVPERPTPAQVAAARDLLLELLVNFPFVDKGSRANALAALLTLPLRPLFPLAPLFAIDAPMPGTGKSLLARLVAIVAQGREPHAIPEPDDPEEARKVLTSLIREGAGLVWIDNVEKPLKGGALCAVLTSTTWRDRVLGVSETAKLEHSLTAVCTGNNLQVLGDLVRRTVWSRLDAQVPNPEERSGFRHPLPDWAFAARPRLLSAVFTLARAWIATGRPAPAGVPPMAGFEAWQRAVGGALEVAGVPGFLANRAEQRAALDDAVPAWAAFVAAWARALPEPVTAKRLAQAAAADENLGETVPEELGDPTDRGFAKALGYALRKRAGQRLALPEGGVAWVERGEKSRDARAVRWRARVAA